MENLGIDIKLLAAQIVNFTILLVVLKKLLYKPLIKLIDDRNKKISDSIENSKKIEERLNSLEQKEADILAKARSKASDQKEELIALAEAERENIINSAKEESKKEIEKGLAAIKSAEAEAVSKLSEKFMNELVSKLQSKLTTDAKNKNYPSLKKILK